MNTTTDKPLVTVLMPVYNAEKYLREAIDSILQQEFTDLEFLIINDGSTDTSEEIILSYDDPRIRYVKNNANLKLIATLNKGLELARGKYIARMDADDISLPHRLGKQVAFMESHPEVGVCGSWFLSFGSSTGVSKYPISDTAIRYTALYQCPFCHPSVILRTKVIRENRLEYSVKYPHAEDYELWLRMSRFCAFANLNEVLIQHRKHANSISRREAAAQTRLGVQIRKQFFEKLGLHPSLEELELFRAMNYQQNDFSFNGLQVLGDLLARMLSATQHSEYLDINWLSPLLEERWYHLCTNHAYLGHRVWRLYQKSELKKTSRISRIQLLKFFAKTIWGIRKPIIRSTGTTPTKVTVLMPVYNAESFVSEAIGSILNQSMPHFELLIIDDGSTDKSLEIIRGFSDPRIRIERNEVNLGLIATLNKGLGLIGTDYMARMDADDISLPSRLGTQLKLMEENPEIGLCGTWFDNFNEQNRWSGGRYESNDFAIRLKHLYQIHISHGTAMFRMDMFNDGALRFDSDFAHAEDYDLFDRIGQTFKLFNIPQIHYLVRQHEASVSKRFQTVQEDNSTRIKERIFSRLGVQSNKEKLNVYRMLQHRDYEKLFQDDTKLRVLLTDMFLGNQRTREFDPEAFRIHLSCAWFHYCLANAHRLRNAFHDFRTASFGSIRDITVVQMLKLLIKSHLK